MTLSLIAGVVSFLLTVIAMPHFITYYKLKKIGGQQMHEDVKQHLEKAGTPTMGGTVFLTVAIIVSVLFSFIESFGIGAKPYGATIGILFVILIYGVIGFLDDFLKIFRQINEGLKPWQKMSLQIIAGLIFYFVHVRPSGTDFLSIGGLNIHLGVFYVLFVLFWIVGFSNAVNLTDGIDGLASISVVISLIAYGIIAYMKREFDILLLIVIMIGALLGFFVFNHKPAKVFMGDVGSLSLGAMLAAISIALRVEWTLLLIGIVYVLETASVMLQVTYFKYTKRKYGEGRRIFRMTPFHHHLELGGLTLKKAGAKWSEWKVDAFLWTVGAVMSIITLLIIWNNL
ncbi:phospho-N-acetylmuramoyl-pentapeptide-transferase [Streptococcus dentiloxodontae]